MLGWMVGLVSYEITRHFTMTINLKIIIIRLRVIFYILTRDGNSLAVKLIPIGWLVGYDKLGI